jgi:hypothetical protein
VVDWGQATLSAVQVRAAGENRTMITAIVRFKLPPHIDLECKRLLHARWELGPDLATNQATTSRTMPPTNETAART